MVLSSYIQLSPSKTKAFLKNINESIDQQGLHTENVKIMVQNLSFCENWKYVVCEDFSTVPNILKTYLMFGKIIKPVKYSSNPYKYNDMDKMNIKIIDKNIIDYLLFYYRLFINGSDKLLPIIHTDDIEWQDDLSPMATKSLEKDLFNYPKIESNKNGFYVTIPCIFRQSIIIVKFFIDYNGIITIEDRHSLADDLPIKSFP